MATIATTMAILQTKSFTTHHPKTTTKTTTTATMKAPISFTTPLKPLTASNIPTVIAGAIFAAMSSSDAALAAQQIAELAEGGGGSDNRGLALLIPIVPAVLWVLYNILQPALNQLNRMRNDKGLVAGLGLGGGLAAAGFLSTPSASAAEAAGGDGRGLLLLFVVAPAVLWVLYNILQPALNQINRMRSG